MGRRKSDRRVDGERRRYESNEGGIGMAREEGREGEAEEDGRGDPEGSCRDEMEMFYCKCVSGGRVLLLLVLHHEWEEEALQPEL